MLGKAELVLGVEIRGVAHERIVEGEDGVLGMVVAAGDDPLLHEFCGCIGVARIWFGGVQIFVACDDGFGRQRGDRRWGC